MKNKIYFIILLIFFFIKFDLYAEQYLCISQSIPQETINNYFNSKLSKDVIFVFRTFDRSMIKFLVPILKKKKLKLIINPLIFNQYLVNKVPCFISVKDKKVGKIYGALSLHGFIEFINTHGYKDHGLRGKTWSIQELNININNSIDIKSLSKNITKNIYENTKCYSFNECENKSYYVINNFFNLKNDIKDNNGNILLNKGTINNKININNVEIIIFNNINQVGIIKLYIHTNQDKYIILIYDCGKNINEIQNKFKRKVYLLSDFIINRLQITCLPVLIQHINNNFYIKSFK